MIVTNDTNYQNGNVAFEHPIVKIKTNYNSEITI